MGRLLSHRFAKLGCELVLWDVNKEGNDQTAAQVKRLGVKVQAYEVDLSKREDVYKVADMVSAATAVWGSRVAQDSWLLCVEEQGGSGLLAPLCGGAGWLRTPGSFVWRSRVAQDSWLLCVEEQGGSGLLAPLCGGAG